MKKRMTLDEAKDWLGDRWLLAVPVKRIVGPTPRHLESRGQSLTHERSWRECALLRRQAI